MKPIKRILVANRGEIAVRILKTAQKMGLETVAVFSEADRAAPHVQMADRAECIGPSPVDQSYLNPDKILQAAKIHQADAIHPGYGLLSEDADFAEACDAEGLVFIGPTPKQLREFGLKHRARALASETGVPLAPGSGLIRDLANAELEAEAIGYPVMLKGTAGGGGIGMALCATPEELKGNFERVRRLAESNFGNAGIFLEKFFPRARHLEVQVFGDGQGQALSLGVRDCSAQRRNQKVLEETPPIGVSPETLASLEESARNLAMGVRYRSAGTVEFLYDQELDSFFFLEVNTRLQVEHGVTELVHGIDLVEWMIRLAQGDTKMFKDPVNSVQGHAVQARVYAENPARNFEPCSGLISQVKFPEQVRWDGWIGDGTEVTPFYDPLLAKILAHGKDRNEAIQKLEEALNQTEIHGIQTNLEYLSEWVGKHWSRTEPVHTRSLENFSFSPRTIEVLRAGTQTTVQDYPGRLHYWEVGIPPSGPMDNLSFRLGNQIVGNHHRAAGLEITAVGPRLRFQQSCMIAICGASAKVHLNDKPLDFWQAHEVSEGDLLDLGQVGTHGMRYYLTVSGGLEIPDYLGSQSTFTLGKFGGHCGRALQTGDILRLGDCETVEPFQKVMPHAIPVISDSWTLDTLYGPHAAPDYLTVDYMETFFEAEWEVHYNSDRTGVRLLGPKPQWARPDGGEAGLHPSNLHDNPYAVGAVDFTGDMPVILGPDGPSLGGFACPATVITADLWKLGQLRPGDRVQFRLVSHPESLALLTCQEDLLGQNSKRETNLSIPTRSPKDMDCVLDSGRSEEDQWIIRQSGDQNLLIEFGEPELDLRVRFKVHLFYQLLMGSKITGIIDLTPGIRSLQVHFEPQVCTRNQAIEWILSNLNKLEEEKETSVPSRIVWLPLSWDDPTTQLAVEKYQKSVRPDAPWYPDNIEFIRRINGLSDIDKVRQIAFEASYVVLGLGDVYLGAPVATPLDPRHRLVTTKYNPARTWTPENAVGIGGAYLCVYGMEGPGGYQLMGRTIQMWNRYNRGGTFPGGKPWLLRFFDQIRFYPVSASELEEIRHDFPLRRYSLRIEESSFDLKQYEDFLLDNQEDITQFKSAQQKAFEEERSRWQDEESEFSDTPPEPEIESEQMIPKGTEGVESQVTGNLWKWLVQLGEEVVAGQNLAVIESMKMEITVESPVEGIVHSMLKAEGELVKTGGMLLLIETKKEESS